jgi:hypothetical protein
MAKSAAALLATFTVGQAKAALAPLDPAAVGDWHYAPRAWPGLPLKAMDETQRRLLWHLVDLTLSESGAARARAILVLEAILGELEGRPAFRDPENYHFRCFGRPSAEALWGWRFEGHHLSLTAMLDPERGVLPTPIFMGANRATVPPPHPRAGLRTLPEEADQGFALLHGLDDARRARAILAERSPGDVITGPGRELSLRALEGVPLADLPDASRAAALALVELYVGRLTPALATTEMAAIREAGTDRIHFAWAGSTTPGRGHYYRLQGPSFVIEYENSQNDANHCHSVWHNPLSQFGRDLLRGHFHHSH